MKLGIAFVAPYDLRDTHDLPLALHTPKAVHVRTITVKESLVVHICWPAVNNKFTATDRPIPAALHNVTDAEMLGFEPIQPRLSQVDEFLSLQSGRWGAPEA